MTDQEQALLAARPDFAAIAQWVNPGARVLDLGCGDGSLLRYLWQARQAPGYGVEIDDQRVLACVANDVNVLQVDLESGLSLFADGSFDCVILSETLQTIHRTELLMREMLLYRRARQKVEVIATSGTWVGATEDISEGLGDQELCLEPGDVLLLYTDGVIEAQNTEGEQFGLERLSEAFVRRIQLGVGRFDLIYTAGAQQISARLRAVELYGTKVIPMVRDILAG